MATTKTLKLKNSALPSLNLTAKNMPTLNLELKKHLNPQLVNASQMAINNKGKIPAIGRMNT